MAAATDMTLVYGNEMDGVNSGKTDFGYEPNAAEGSEGNAILSRLPVLRVRLLELPCVRNRFKAKHKTRKVHSAVVAHLRTRTGEELVCYSIHLDAFSGRVVRLMQLRPVMEDAARMVAAGCHVLAGGDLNTHNHGLARLMGKFTGDDPYRWSSFGMTEGQWFQQMVLEAPIPALAHKRAALARYMEEAARANPKLAAEVMPDDLNPAKLRCAFADSIVTTMALGGVYTAKLDWMLVSQGVVANDTYVSESLGLLGIRNAPSDHEYLVAELRFLADSGSYAS